MKYVWRALLIALMIFMITAENVQAAEILGIVEKGTALKEKPANISKTIKVTEEEEILSFNNYKGDYLEVDGGYIRNSRVNIIFIKIKVDKSLTAYNNVSLTSADTVPKGSMILLTHDVGKYYVGQRANGNQFLIDKKDLKDQSLAFLKKASFPSSLVYIQPTTSQSKKNYTYLQYGEMFIANDILNVSNIINSAKSYLGLPYVWGGGSLTLGADCSGFLKAILKLHGLHLSGPSYEMVNYGVKVDYNNLKPGDFMYFDTMNLNRISHVSMYIGDGQMIHAASSSTGVIISDISDYHKKFITAKRILK